MKKIINNQVVMTCEEKWICDIGKTADELKETISQHRFKWLSFFVFFFWKCIIIANTCATLNQWKFFFFSTFTTTHRFSFTGFMLSKCNKSVKIRNQFNVVVTSVQFRFHWCSCILLIFYIISFCGIFLTHFWTFHRFSFHLNIFFDFDLHKSLFSMSIIESR